MVKTLEPFWSYQSRWQMDVHHANMYGIFNGSSSSSIMETNELFGLVWRTLTLLRNEL
jgi:hypothetical protein